MTPSMTHPTAIAIDFDQGTLAVHAHEEQAAILADYLTWDPRCGYYRAEASHYAPILLTLHRLGLPFRDGARAFQRHTFIRHDDPPPRPHQQEAMAGWIGAEHRGVVVLPTGAGKSLVARLAIARIGRDTLVVVPTLDLMHQWYEQLSRVFRLPVGLLGGGEHTLQAITIATYDSAALYMHRLGNRFGLLICDECHHLPSLTTRIVAQFCIAPFRLGLTATPERNDGGEKSFDHLLGPICHRSEITDLEGRYLAPYELIHVAIQLDEDEREAYDLAYERYRTFARENRIVFRTPADWSKFMQVCARSREGREAFTAWRFARGLAKASRAKLRTLWTILCRHRHQQAILFTDDNATAYTIGETFFLPVITHHTKISERKALLTAFREGKVNCMVTSRVLNEGVDVPEVAVGIVVSGSGSVREHVQRLGRILRPGPDKRAVLYELVSEDTGETFTSVRRRQHAAYQRE
ncbi:MAG: DEAD/DEAH box helicase [Magnetococcales bacterium]|nr:DEAD/DEAH box helicase [Magnetococcales bacterium]